LLALTLLVWVEPGDLIGQSSYDDRKFMTDLERFMMLDEEFHDGNFRYVIFIVYRRHRR
jgi:hypothetical protein